MTRPRGCRPGSPGRRCRTRSRHRTPSGWPRSETTGATMRRCARGPPDPRAQTASLEVLPGGDPLDGAAALGLLAAGDQRADVDDPLALLARDLRPVVGVGGVGQVLVLLELLADGVDEVLGGDALLPAGDQALDRELLRPPDDVLDHGPGGEVLEVQGLLVTVLVGDLEEPVVVVGPVHVLDGGLDHV